MHYETAAPVGKLQDKSLVRHPEKPEQARFALRGNGVALGLSRAGRMATQDRTGRLTVPPTLCRLHGGECQSIPPIFYSRERGMALHHCP